MINNIVEIFAIISAAATAFYAFVAYKTLLEVKTQRETVYKPEIIIDESPFYVYSYETGNGDFPGYYTFDKKDPLYKPNKPHFEPLSINIFNIGLGTAKDVNIEYSIDLEEIIRTINEVNKNLPHDKIIEISRTYGVITFRPGINAPTVRASYTVDNQRKRKINHILPVNISSDPFKEFLPSYLFGLHSILIYSFWLDSSEMISFPRLPAMNIKINYLDIGNKRHYKEIELTISFYGGTKNESYNAFNVRETNNT